MQRARRLLHLSLGVLLATAGGAAADSPAEGPAPSAAPKIAFDRETHDFGLAKQEQELSAEFTVKNVGGSTLHVADVKGDCGCSQPKMATREIAPGGTATLSVVFHTLTFSGPMSKRIHVITDDPARPDAIVVLRLDVSAGIVLDPPRFYFGNVLKGTSPSMTVGAKWRDGVGRPFQVTKVEGPGLENLAFDVKPLEAPPWHGWSVTASFKTPPPIGTVSGTALIRTDDPDYPRISVAVTAFVSGKVWLLMREVSFGFVKYGAGRSIPVSIRPLTDDLDLGEVKVTSRKGLVEATATRVAGRPKEWTVFIRLPETAEPGKVEDVVEIRTAIADEPVTEIPVHAEVLPRPPGTSLPPPAQGK